MKKTILLLIAGVAAFAAENGANPKTYRDRAEQLEAKAIRHEANAEELTNRKGYNPMRHKWPAMVQAPIDKERHLAMQARRAAREAREMAAKLEAGSTVKSGAE